MRIVKISISLFFVAMSFAICNIILKDQNLKINSPLPGGDYEVYKSSIMIDSMGLTPVKKTMYSVVIDKKCRINWDVFHLSGEISVDNLKLDFNYVLDGCEYKDELIKTISSEMIVKIGRQWDLHHVREVVLQRPSHFVDIDSLINLIGNHKLITKDESKERLIYSLKKKFL